MKRRTFLKTTSAAVVSMPAIISTGALGATASATSPNSRIGLGLIGCGGQGCGDFFNLMNNKEIQALAVCDPDKSHQDRAKGEVEKRYAADKASGTYKGCASYGDFRELCARKDIDAVVIGTPDHWHALAALEALRNGKDVYCEKPITHLFTEGQVLYREAAKRKAIFQTGSQQRSDTRFRIAAEIILNGLIGKVQHVEVGLPTGKGSKEEGKIAQEIPPGLDYNMWCGSSRLLPYHKDRLHFNWRWSLDFGGGQLMDWIGHHNDIAHWGLGLDKSGPIKVEAKGFKFPQAGIWDAPIDYEILSEYAPGYTISISNKNTMGTKWIGQDGWVYVNRGKIDASNKEWIHEAFDRGKIKAYKSNSHQRNFVDGILTRKECICPAETAHRSITPGHLGYVSQALGRALKWDPVKEEVIGDAEADARLKKVTYRSPWKLA